MAQYNIILFDLDGTLTDPKIGITKSITFALSKFGIAENNLDKLEAFIGPPLLESFKKYYSFDDLKARKAIDYYREYYSCEGIFEATLYSGIPELLKQLCNDNKRLILVTSKPTVYAERILIHYDLYKYFLSVDGSNLDLTRTSKTEIIQVVLSKLNDCQKNHIVMVGDRGEDIVGARNNGIDSIGVAYGYGSIEELEAVNPKYIAHSVGELKVLID